jgi:hypothetical protein
MKFHSISVYFFPFILLLQANVVDPTIQSSSAIPRSEHVGPSSLDNGFATPHVVRVWSTQGRLGFLPLAPPPLSSSSPSPGLFRLRPASSFLSSLQLLGFELHSVLPGGARDLGWSCKGASFNGPRELGRPLDGMDVNTTACRRIRLSQSAARSDQGSVSCHGPCPLSCLLGVGLSGLGEIWRVGGGQVPEVRPVE